MIRFYEISFRCLVSARSRHLDLLMHIAVKIANKMVSFVTFARCFFFFVEIVRIINIRA